MRRQILVLMLVLAPLLTAFSMPAAALEDNGSPYVYRILAVRCPGGVSQQSTGFRIVGATGIYTALHGVAGCGSITAYGKNNADDGYPDLYIREIDVDHDVALLASVKLEGEGSQRGLQPATSAAAEGAAVEIVGYPKGYTQHQQRARGEVVERHRPLIQILPENDKGIKDLVARHSPNVEKEVIHLRAPLEHGLSGAPVLLSGDRLIGMANGGLDDGLKDKTWAIPWPDVKMVSERTAGATYISLKKIGPSGFEFSAAELIGTSAEVDPTPVSETGTIKSYRLNTSMYITVKSGNQYYENVTVMDAAYSGKNRRLSFVMEENIPDAGTQEDTTRTSFEATTINGMQYVRYGSSQCAQPGASNAALDDLQESLYSALTDLPGSGTLDVSDLGPEEVNGVKTEHYLLEKPLAADGEGDSLDLNEVTAAEVWLRQDDELLVKANVVATADYSLPEDPDPASAVIVFSVDVTDINKNLNITMPVTCTDQAAPGSLAGAKVSAQIEDYSVEHNVSYGDQVGMSVKLNFTTKTTVGRPGMAAFAVYTEDGVPLRASTNAYRAGDGSLVATVDYEPGYANTRYDELEIFMPYAALDLVDGFHTLQVLPYVYDGKTGEMLAVAEAPRYFSVAYHSDAALPWVGLGDMRSEEAKAIVDFMSRASSAQSLSLRYLDPSYLSDYYASTALAQIQDYIASLLEQGLYEVAQFDPERSYLLAVEPAGEGAWNVGYCEYWTITSYNITTGKAVSSSPLEAQPQALSLHVIDGGLYITAFASLRDANWCAAP